MAGKKLVFWASCAAACCVWAEGQYGPETVTDGAVAKAFASRPKDFDCLTIKKECYVPVGPAHPVAVLWETRNERKER